MMFERGEIVSIKNYIKYFMGLIYSETVKKLSR